MARVGERMRDAAPHPPRADGCDDLRTRALHPLQPFGQKLRHLRPRQAGQVQALERTARAREVPAGRHFTEAQETVRSAAGHAGPAADGSKEAQAHLHVLGHVAMRIEIELLVPIAAIDQFVVREVAVHPVRGRVVVGEREMRRPVAERLARGDPLRIECVVHAADRRLRAFLVDVPSGKMRDGARIHDDERRMDDRAGVHQGRGAVSYTHLDVYKRQPRAPPR